MKPHNEKNIKSFFQNYINFFPKAWKRGADTWQEVSVISVKPKLALSFKISIKKPTEN
jgi:hypothetical protein